MFASVQSALVFLIALLTLGPLLWTATPRLLPTAARASWERLGRSARAAMVFALVLVAGMAVSKEPQRGMRSNTLPAWFVALGYDPADTDGDGIPDCWETWTRTNPAVADSGQDPDSDGASNLVEFQNQCDPLLADTDGDGIDDATEMAGLAEGVPDLHPLIRASYPASAPDADGDGIPDEWEYAVTNLFAGAGASGFPLGYAIPAADASNYDVLLTISTSRHALLTRRNGADDAECLIPPCTNLAIRLRLDSGNTQTPTLRAVPQGATNALAGTWRASMSAAWDSRREQATEGNRVATGGGVMVDCEAEGCYASFEGALGAGGAAQSRGATGGTGSGILGLDFAPKWMSISWFVNSGCWEHGPSPMIEICETNLPPPYLWSYGLHEYESWSPFFSVPLGWLGDWTTWLYCHPLDEAHTNLVPGIEFLVGAGHCRPSSTNFVAAMAGSTHDPQDGSDHEPGVGTTQLEQPGINCPEAFVLVVTSGWTHAESMLHIRNLVRIQTGNAWDDETDHCIGIVWSDGGSINLYDYLADCCKPFAESYGYYVNGAECRDGILQFGEEPNEIDPSMFHIELRLASGELILDRMWVVIYSRRDLSAYSLWKTDNSDTSWTSNLPPVYSSIALSTNWNSISPSSGVSYSLWNPPSPSRTFLHHNATYGMRSVNIGEHGHQATYDKNGDVIINTVAAGTADFKHPLSIVFPAWTIVREDHYRHDVVPFLRAMVMDGNPCRYNNRYAPTNINRPMLYQGENLDEYLTLRPPIPTGVQNR